VGWGKGNISFGGAFCFAKYALQIRRKNFRQPKRGRGGIPPTPPFRLALASDGDFFGGFGKRANFIGAPPLLFFHYKQILEPSQIKIKLPCSVMPNRSI